MNRELRTGSKYNRTLSPSRKRVNLSYLQEMSGGDVSFIEEVIRMFLDIAPDAVLQVMNYLKNENYPMLKSVAHKLKPTVQMLGDTELHSLIVAVEELCISGDTNTPEVKEELSAMTNTMVRETQQLIKALEAELLTLKED